MSNDQDLIRRGDVARVITEYMRKTGSDIEALDLNLLIYDIPAAKFIPPPMPDPDMTADQMRLHMGELTTREVHLVRAALKWAWRSVHGQDKGDSK